MVIFVPVFAIDSCMMILYCIIYTLPAPLQLTFMSSFSGAPALQSICPPLASQQLPTIQVSPPPKNQSLIITHAYYPLARSLG